MDKWIYHQKRDNLYIAKVFHNKKEYYIGGFKNKEDAIQARDKALPEILAGKTSKYRSRSNSNHRKKSTDLDLRLESAYMDEPEYQLRYAVLMCSINDVCQSVEHPEYSKSRNWILGLTPSAKTFSFEEICDLFHLNSAAVREKVLNIDEETKERLRQVLN